MSKDKSVKRFIAKMTGLVYDHTISITHHGFWFSGHSSRITLHAYALLMTHYASPFTIFGYGLYF
jgi:hypothetical protein